MGANLPSQAGTPLQTLQAALAALQTDDVILSASSRLYRTPCLPAGAGPDYVNAAASIVTTRDAQGLMAHLHSVEARFGRARAQRWGMRTLDLDLLALGDSVLPDAATQAAWRDLPVEEQSRRTPDRLILPHPRLQDRGFVLIPLADIAPDWRHPLTGQTVVQMRDALGAAQTAGIAPV